MRPPARAEEESSVQEEGTHTPYSPGGGTTAHSVLTSLNKPKQVLVMQMGVWDQLRHGMVGDCVTGDHGDPQSDSVNGKELEVARGE